MIMNGVSSHSLFFWIISCGAWLTDTQIFDLKSGSYSCELWEHELHINQQLII